MKKVKIFLIACFLTILVFSGAMLGVILIGSMLVYFFGMRWTIALNITAFVVAVLLLAVKFVCKFAELSDSANAQGKKKGILPRLAKAFYSIFL